MPSLKHNLRKITLFSFSFIFFGGAVIQMLLLRSTAMVKLGCLFHPAVEAGRLLPGTGKAPATKGSIHTPLQHHHSDSGRAGRAATSQRSPARESSLGEGAENLTNVPKKNHQTQTTTYPKKEEKAHFEQSEVCGSAKPGIKHPLDVSTAVRDGRCPGCVDALTSV